MELFDYIEVFYNQRRRHSTIGKISAPRSSSDVRPHNQTVYGIGSSPGRAQRLDSTAGGRYPLAPRRSVAVACIRHRRGAWVLDYRDASGARRWETHKTKHEAEDALARVVPESRQKLSPGTDRNVTVREYSKRWLQLVGGLKTRTLESYRGRLNLHILPALGSLPLRRLNRSAIKTLLAEKREAGLGVDSVRLIHCAIRGMLNAAVDEGIILANPAAGLGRSMKLSRSSADRRERIRAFDRKQLTRFLVAAEAKNPRLYPLFLLMARTGLRLGETLALRWEDLDLDAKELRVERALGTKGETDSPKSGHGRTVDLGASTRALLRRLKARADREALRSGTDQPWMFPGKSGEPMPHGTVQQAFARALKAAGLPGGFSCHSLRHSYASQLLADGTSPAYVQEQLGHASIELTVGTYGRWLRKRAPGAVDRLDGNEVVAETAEVVAEAAPVGSAVLWTESPKVLSPRQVAEREGFEPSVPGLPAHVISSHADSTTLASLRGRAAPTSRGELSTLHEPTRGRKRSRRRVFRARAYSPGRGARAPCERRRRRPFTTSR